VIATCTVDKDIILDDAGRPRPRFPVDRLLIEAKATGISVAQEMTRLYAFTGKFGIELIDPKRFGDKVARVNAVEHLFSQGMIYAPDRAFADLVIEEMAIFPNGKHDDLTDSTSQALRYLREMGFALHTDEYGEETANELMHRSRPQAIYPV